MSIDLPALYRRQLEPWPSAMRRHFYGIPGSEDLTCFGPGDHGHWAVQTNATAAAALAVLATDTQTDPQCTGMSTDEMLDLALCTTRFALRSNHVGGGTATDGETWGRSWISALALERMMHGLEALDDHLTDSDRDCLQRVLLSESDWLLDHYPVVAGLSDGALNKPESNIWNGCILLRTALMFPDTPRRDAFLEKGTAFLLNGISIPEDAKSTEIIEGRPLSDWYVGANIFNSMACDHHGYLNVGYMAICLSNIAMLHCSCRAQGWQAPEALYHHARELWQLVKTCTFPDGRLWRIGGDTRARYCYCQDYAIPVWLWAQDFLGDHEAASFEHGWLDQIQKEARHNEDGSFLSGRLKELESVSPLYYARLEGDRAVSLSMGAYWHRKFFSDNQKTAAANPPIPILNSWLEQFHGATLVRGEKRLVSWTWRSAEGPQGLCLPPNASTMAEWRGNLSPRIHGMGMSNDHRGKAKQMETFEGGFATCGSIHVHSEHFIAEGESARIVALIDLACVALPDDQSLVILQRAGVAGRTGLREVKGLFLQIPNDLFNGMRRHYTSAEGGFVLAGCPGTAETRTIPGNWLNIDDCLSVTRLYGPELSIFRPADRQITLRALGNRLHTAKAGGSIYADEVCCGCHVDSQHYDAGSLLLDLGAVVRSGITAAATRTLSEKNADTLFVTSSPDCRGLQVTGGTGSRYLVIANFGKAPAREEISLPVSVLAGGTLNDMGDSKIELNVPEGHVAVLGIHS